MQECEAKPIQQTVAAMVMQQVDKVVDQANATADRVMNKLSSVMIPESPKSQGSMELKDPMPQRQYPELFDTLRSKLRAIEHCLNNINEGLDRTEL